MEDSKDKMEAEAEPVSRLMIRKMTLRNFKSYAGEKEIGPFHKVSAFLWPLKALGKAAAAAAAAMAAARESDGEG